MMADHHVKFRPVEERVYRCDHGVPIATRKPCGTWLLHGYGGCVRCSIRHLLRRPVAVHSGSVRPEDAT